MFRKDKLDTHGMVVAVEATRADDATRVDEYEELCSSDFID